MTPQVSILQAIDDPNLFGPWFQNPKSWARWRAFLATQFALPATPSERKTFRELTGRKRFPTKPYPTIVADLRASLG